MNFTEMKMVSDYFNPVCFTRFYNEKLKCKKGRGLNAYNLLEALCKRTG